MQSSSQHSKRRKDEDEEESREEDDEGEDDEDDPLMAALKSVSIMDHPGRRGLTDTSHMCHGRNVRCGGGGVRVRRSDLLTP